MDKSIDKFQTMVSEMKKNLTGDYQARPDNIYLEGEPANREIIGSFLDKIMKPESRINGVENLKKLYTQAKAGKSCLLLIEHYSNFDYPALFRLIEKNPDLGPDVANCLIPIQGMKLSEGSALTAAFSNSYTTIVIYPSRSIDTETDPKKLEEIKQISNPINHAAMRELTRRKYSGNIIIVFPAGTRYRPWEPDSKKGVREIYTYLKVFDFIEFVSINGNLLVPCQENDMEKDTLQEDVIHFTVSEPVEGKDFRQNKAEETPDGEDPKQYVVDQVMAELEKLHNQAEIKRKKLL